jgi:hypothetical protein
MRGVIGAEFLDQRRHRRAVRSGEGMGDLVGVDDRGAAGGEQVGDGGLAAADAAGEADAESRWFFLIHSRLRQAHCQARK